MQCKGSAGVLLDGDTIVHVVHPQYLLLSVVAAQLVVLTHDEGFHGLRRADF